jgi:hypothetical protein
MSNEQNNSLPLRGPWQADYYPDHVSVYSDEIMDDYAFRIEFSSKMPEVQRESTLAFLLAASETAAERDELKTDLASCRTSLQIADNRNGDLRTLNAELLEALKELFALEIKGHSFANRLQFSNGGRALAAKVGGAIAKAEGRA